MQAGGDSEALRQRVTELEAQLEAERASKEELSRKVQKQADKIGELEEQLAEVNAGAGGRAVNGVLGLVSVRMYPAPVRVGTPSSCTCDQGAPARTARSRTAAFHTTLLPCRLPREHAIRLRSRSLSQSILAYFLIVTAGL